MEDLIRSNNLETLKSVMHDASQSMLNCALIYALEYNKPKIVEYLVNSGANLNNVIHASWGKVLRSDEMLSIVIPLITDYSGSMIIWVISSISPKIYTMILPHVKNLHTHTITYDFCNNHVSGCIYSFGYIIGEPFYAELKYNSDISESDFNQCMCIFTEYGGHIFDKELDKRIPNSYLTITIRVYLNQVFTQHPNLDIPTIIDKIADKDTFYEIHSYLMKEGYIQ